MSEKLISDAAAGEPAQLSLFPVEFISKAEGVEVLVGQGVGIGRPPAGETVFVKSKPGDHYKIEFDPGSARVSISDGNLQLHFDDGSRLVFESLADAADSGNAPVFDIAGADINARLLLGQARAFVDETLETAAGTNSPLPGSGGEYVDDLGETISLLGRQGVLDGTALEFGLITLEDVVALVLEEPVAEQAIAPDDPSDPDDPDAAAVVVFSLQGPAEITEGGAPGSFNVTMTGDALAAGESASVRLTIDPNTVTLGSDTDQTLAELIAEIAAQAGAAADVAVAATGADFVDLVFSGNDSFSFDVQAVVDSFVENNPNESFTLSLGSVSGSGGVDAEIAPGQGSVTTEIVDVTVGGIPVAEDNVNRVGETDSAAFNLLLVLDASSSMLDASGVGTLTRFDLLVESYKSLLLSYQAVGVSVTVQVAEFGGFVGNARPPGGVEATISGPDLSVAEALAYLDTLDARLPGSNLDSTNYRAATEIAMDNFTASATAENIVYFASDGAPNSGFVNRPIWEGYLGSDIRAIAVGIGDGVNINQLARVAFPNIDENLVLVPQDGELSTKLQATLPGSVSGNVIEDQEDPSSGLTDIDDFGPDGAGAVPVTQFTHIFSGEGTVIFSAASAAGAPHVVAADGRTVTVETDAGGRLTFDFLTGDYVYLHPASVSADFTEVFSYTIEDSDGSQSSADLRIDVSNNPNNDGAVVAAAGLAPVSTNLAPLAEDDSFVLSLEDLVPGSVLGNVIDGSGSLAGLIDSDPDGDALSVVSASVDTASAGYSVATQSAGLGAGIVAAVDLISDDGEIEIRVAEDGVLTLSAVDGDPFSDLPAGAQVVLSLDYGIADGAGGSDNAVAQLIFAGGGGLQAEDTDAGLVGLV